MFGVDWIQLGQQLRDELGRARLPAHAATDLQIDSPCGIMPEGVFATFCACLAFMRTLNQQEGPGRSRTRDPLAITASECSGLGTATPRAVEREEALPT